MQGSTRGMLRVGAAAVTCVAMVVGLAGCGGSQGSGQDPDASTQFDPIVVVSSINQWGILAKELGGDQVKVTSILGSTNVDAHDFEPRTSDIATISKARILVANGAGYDDWATKAVTGDTTIVSAADAVGASDGDNPHLWFSKDARKAMARELSDAFAKTKPDEGRYFSDRLEDWSKSEAGLESTMDDFAERHRNATYAATESVAHYLMSDLKVRDVTPEQYTQASLNDGEPAPADVQSLQSLIEGHKAGLVVNNPQEASDMTNLVTGTAHKSDVPVVDVSEQVPEGQKTLVDWMTSLISEMDKALDESAELPQPQSSQSPSK
ncbi:metal ABC transporter solute-binding protein, Zn/Mn family [Bifidobacterium catulorum]|nr:zinc ABC transporter substrate-binding protein [Bifidobacterium catulorum]